MLFCTGRDWIAMSTINRNTMRQQSVLAALCWLTTFAPLVHSAHIYSLVPLIFALSLSRTRCSNKCATGHKRIESFYKLRFYSFVFARTCVRFPYLSTMPTVYHLTAKTIRQKPDIHFDRGQCGYALHYFSTEYSGLIHPLYQLNFAPNEKSGLANLMFNWFRMAIVSHYEYKRVRVCL